MTERLLHASSARGTRNARRSTFPGTRLPLAAGNTRLADLRPLSLQAKLLVGRSDDPLEREADRTAEGVLRGQPVERLGSIPHRPQQKGNGTLIRRQRARAAVHDHRFEAEGVSVVVRRSCGRAGFGFNVVEEGTREALRRIFHTECIEQSRRRAIQRNLQRHGLDIRCSRSRAWCAESTGFPIPANIFTLGIRTFAPDPAKAGCEGGVPATVLHEIIHLTRGFEGEQLPNSCENSCFGTHRGDPVLCRDIDVHGHRRSGQRAATTESSPLGARRPVLAGHGPANQGLQGKLLVGRSNDPLEREADRAAEQVLRVEPVRPLGNAPHYPQRKCAICEVEERETLRRQPLEEEPQIKLEAGGPRRTGVQMAVVAVAQGGHPLSPAERAYFEPRFGLDFSQVRVHDEPQAYAAAQAIDARAFTLGRHIAFGRGEYRPGTTQGRRLLAHELAHVVQQGGGGERGVVRRTDGRGGGSAAGTPTPAYGRACSGGTRDPCQYARCSGHHTSIAADLSRAIGYVQTAIRALAATPLATDTRRALDWYFNDTTSATARTVRIRLSCIRDCLQATRRDSNYGCQPRENNALAYVCVGSTPVCTDRVTRICLTDSHFRSSPRVRAQTLIHECAHRVGMSLGRPHSEEDIYRHTSRFLFLNTSEALLNSDSYALFAGAISEGVPVTFAIIEPTLTGGLAQPGRGRATWQARLYLGTEIQHPVLGIVNPTLGIGLSVIGETTTGGRAPVTAGPSMLASLLAGVRIGDPRPGAAGGGYASFFGGPSVALGRGRSTARLGAEAGTALGYRWRWLDISAGLGYAYDPTRAAGMQHLFTVGASLSFIPAYPAAPGQ